MVKWNWQRLKVGESMTLPINRRSASASAKTWGKKLNRKFYVSETDGEVVVTRMEGEYRKGKYPWEKMKVGDRIEMDCQLNTARALASKVGMRMDRHFMVSEEDGEIVCRRFR